MRFNLENSINKINLAASYFLIIFLWAPHGARECVEICDGPFFISPMIGTFLMPNWTMDMSLRGWLLQILFAPPLVFLFYILTKYQEKKRFIFLKIYLVRWLLMWFGILTYYNFVFWTTFRDTLIPFFSF